MYEDTFDETEELSVEELNNVLTEMENLEEQMLEEEELRVIRQQEEVYDDDENEQEENYHEMHEEENNTPTNTSSSSSASSSSSDETNNDEEQEEQEEQEQEQEQELYECVVCYKQAKPLDTIKAPCGHIHCSNCFFRWISINPTCTICRTSLVSFEKFIQNRDMEEEMDTTNRIMYEMSKAINEKREVYSALDYQIKGGENILKNIKEESNELFGRANRLRNDIDYKKGYIDAMECEVNKFYENILMCSKNSNKSRGFIDGFVDRLKNSRLVKEMKFPAKRKHVESPTSQEPRKRSMHSATASASSASASSASASSASASSASASSASASASTESEPDPTKNIFERFMFKPNNKESKIEKIENAINNTAINSPFNFYRILINDYADYRKSKIKYNELKKKYKNLREKHVATMNPSGLFEFGRDDVSDVDDRLVRPRLRIRIPTPRISFENDGENDDQNEEREDPNYITPPAEPTPSSPPQIQR